MHFFFLFTAWFDTNTYNSSSSYGYGYGGYRGYRSTPAKAADEEAADVETTTALAAEKA
jgi:hypothetical protein